MKSKAVAIASYRAPRQWRRTSRQADLDVYGALTGLRPVLMPVKGLSAAPAPDAPVSFGGRARRAWAWCKERGDAYSAAATLQLKEVALPRLRRWCERAARTTARRTAEGWARLAR